MQLCVLPVYCCVTNHLKFKVLKSQSFFLISPVCSLGRAQEGNLCTLWCQLGQLEWELRVHLQDGSHACLASWCWLPTRPSVDSHGLPECFTERCLGAKSTYAKLREEKLSASRCGPRTWYCRTSTTFCRSGSHKAQTQRQGCKPTSS